MDTYNIMREFAESWGLFAMFLVFLVVLFRTLLPGNRKGYEDAANIAMLRGDNLEDDLKTVTKLNPPRKEART